MDHIFLLYDHLEGEAREEIKYCTKEEKEDPNKKILVILKEMYGCLSLTLLSLQSSVLLYRSFFSLDNGRMKPCMRSHALFDPQIVTSCPNSMPNKEVCYVINLWNMLMIVHFTGSRINLFATSQLPPCWRYMERLGSGRECQGGGQSRSHSLPTVCGLQYGVQAVHKIEVSNSATNSELTKLKKMLMKQQEQL